MQIVHSEVYEYPYENCLTLIVTDNLQKDKLFVKEKIIEGINGLFVSMPSQKGNDGEYYDSVFATKETRDQLNKVALDEYSGENFTDSSFSQQSQVPAATTESNPEPTPNTATNEPVDENNKPYEDSDIPF